MAQWMRCDVDFGAPMVALCVGARELYGSRWWSPIKECREDPEAMRVVVEQMVVDARPSMAGLTVIMMGVDLRTAWWTFVVVHPSLPRLKFGEREPRWRLHPCPVCGKDMDVDAMTFVAADHRRKRPMIEVCSQACVDKQSPSFAATKGEWEKVVKPEPVTVTTLSNEPPVDEPVVWLNAVESDVQGFTNLPDRMTPEPLVTQGTVEVKEAYEPRRCPLRLRELQGHRVNVRCALEVGHPGGCEFKLDTDSMRG